MHQSNVFFNIYFLSHQCHRADHHRVFVSQVRNFLNLFENTEPLEDRVKMKGKTEVHIFVTLSLYRGATFLV